MHIIVNTPAPSIMEIRLNRAEKRNALTGDMVRELLLILREACERKDLHVLLLTGEGTHFCAGADLQWMLMMGQSSFPENCADAKCLASLFWEIHHFPCPVVVVVQGAAMGGGMGLLATADIVIAAEDAIFSFPEISIGLYPAVISPWIVRWMGARMAKYYFMTGERFTAETAARLQLVHKIVPAPDLNRDAMVLAEKLVSYVAPALREVRKMTDQVANASVTEKFCAGMAEHLAAARSLPVVQANMHAFLERKK